MNIFGNTVAVALFDNGKDAENAVQELQERGFGETDEDEIQLIDRSRLATETPSKGPMEDSATVPGRGTSGAVGRTTIGVGGSSGEDMLEVDTRETLIDLGVGQEEAQFFARHVAKGSIVITVDTSEERAQEALDIMEKHNARGDVVD